MRLEALQDKQRLRTLSRRRLPLTDTQGRQLAALEASQKASRKKEPQATQIRTLTECLCFSAFIGKRKSLKPAFANVGLHRLIEQGVVSAESVPRVRETAPALRALSRAEALLTRLVWQGAEQQARQELEAKEREANASKTDANA